MLRNDLHAVLLLAVFTGVTLGADDPVFSGPQVGERLPPLVVQGVIGDTDGNQLDPIGDAGGKPILLVFFHELTRPAFGMTKTITQFASGKSDAGMKASVIFLTDDPTATSKWAKNVSQHFTKGVAYGISPDGKDGPGSYGLNRNVTLTILVGRDDKVTANFALVQPQLQADGPKILRAIADVTGGGEVPAISELVGDRYNRRQMNRNRSQRERKASEQTPRAE